MERFRYVVRWVPVVSLILITLSSCVVAPVEGPFSTGGHLVSGGVGPDGIRALNNPPRIAGADMTPEILDPSELVEGVVINGEAMAFPVKLLNWHEIINDTVGGLPLLLSYCPLTGTGIGFDRRLSTGEAQFGVSGLLCDNNLVMFDRTTTSLWPQMDFNSVRGDLMGEELEQIQVFEMPWGKWLELHPDTGVVSLASLGSTIDYDRYPYGTYFTSSRVMFPLRDALDTRLHAKARVLGIKAGGEAKAYPLTDLTGPVVNDVIGGEPVVVLGHGGLDYAVSYSRLVDGEVRTFELSQTFAPRMRDLETGTEWDIHGRAVSGPDIGSQLMPTESYIGFWFAWAAYHPVTEIWNPED